MNGKKVLLVDDDIESLRLTTLVFKKAGAHVVTARNGLECLSIMFTSKPDLVILDIMMPGDNGIDVCKQIRKDSNTPVIMLTALGQDQYILDGLEAGADDYLVKPFSSDILIARSKSVLRRSQITIEHNLVSDYDDGHLKIDIKKHQVFINNKRIKFTLLEYRLLLYFVDNAGRVLSFDNILRNVWGEEYAGSDDYVHIYVSHLRRKIEQDAKRPQYITSVHGVGYLFEKQKYHFVPNDQPLLTK